MSNIPFVRIILIETGTRKRIYEKVNDRLNQQIRAGFANGDADVWHKFLSQQIPKLYGMLIKRWPNPSLAEELVAKTIFDAVRARDSYDASKGSPENWIFAIAQNNIRLEVRKRASRPSIDGDINSYLETIDTQLLPDEVLEQKETTMIVRTALSKLESKEQAALKAKYIEGLSANKIARQMGITEKAVHSLLYRARNSLRSELKHMAPLNKEEQEL